MHPLPKWSRVSFCIPIHINLKLGLLALNAELRTASWARRQEGTEEGDGVGCEIQKT